MMSVGKHRNFPKQGEVCVAGVGAGPWGGGEGGGAGWVKKSTHSFSACADPDP